MEYLDLEGYLFVGRAVQFTLSLLTVENLVSEQSFRSGGNVLLVHSAASER